MFSGPESEQAQYTLDDYYQLKSEVKGLKKMIKALKSEIQGFMESNPVQGDETLGDKRTAYNNMLEERVRLKAQKKIVKAYIKQQRQMAQPEVIP